MRKARPSRRRLTMAGLATTAALGTIRSALAQEAQGAARRLRPLASETRAGVGRVHVLADARLVLVEGDRPFLLTVRPAADGEYSLARSGRVVVRQGRATEVTGTPAANALLQPAP